MTVKTLVVFETMLSRGVLPVIALTLALVAVPLASAQIGGFGYRVTSQDGTTSFSLRSGGPTYITFQDGDTDGVPDAGETVFASSSVTQLQANDIRLSTGVQTPGSDSAVGATITQISGDLRFMDQDANGDFERNETLFWDRSDSNSGRVSAGDVILSGPDVGTIVSGSTPDLNRQLLVLSGQLKYYDEDGNNAYGAGDRVYFDVRGDGYAGVPDIRIGNPGPYAPGSMPQPGDEDATLRFITTTAPSNVVYVDNNGDGLLGATEPVYLSRSTSNVFTGSIRLASPVTGEPGSLVRVGDPDSGRSVTSLSGKFAYSDANGNSRLDSEDVLYYDRSSGTQNRADGNDLILSGPDAGTHVGGSAAHQGTTITSAGGSVKVLDVSGGGNYQAGDLVYLDADNDGFVSPGDVQLTRHQSTAAPQPTDSDGDGVPDSQDDCPDQAADTSDGCPADDGTDGGTTDGGDGSDGDGGSSDSDLQEAREAQQEAREAQRAAQDALDAANEAKEISQQNSELIGQVLDKLNETGQNGSPGPGLVLALIGLAGAALVISRRQC